MVDHLIEIPLPGRRLAFRRPGPADAQQDVTLPSFVAGPENRLVAAVIRDFLAHEEQASVDVASEIVMQHRKPAVLALFGRSGTGKTHLARGLVASWQSRHGTESAEYIAASDFRRAWSEAIDSDTVNEFRQRSRGRALLAIDDLQRLPGDRHLHQELRYMLDAIEDRGGTVLVTSDRPASMLSNLSADLRNRLSAGLLLQLSAPGLDARLRIVRQTSSALDCRLADRLANQLATTRGSAGELISATVQLCADSPTAMDEAAERMQAERAERRPTLREIVAVVARYYGISQKLLKSASRRQSVVSARGVAVYLARELAEASYEQIGRELGRRDHTTIMHNYRKIVRERERDAATRETLDELARILLSR